jgi:uncharacterized protein YkwD
MFAGRIVVVIAIALASLGAAAGASAKATPESKLLVAINKVRAQHGLGALEASKSLTRSATRFGRKLMKADRFTHAARPQVSRRFSTAAEVLGFTHGWSRRPGRVVRMWLKSPGHRPILLSPDYRYVGGSPVRGRFGGGKATIWVVQFGSM